MMFELFKWGFVLAMALTWLAVGVGAIMMLIPSASNKRQKHVADADKRAA